MKILLSPAKKLNLSVENHNIYSYPIFLKEASCIMSFLKKLKKEDLIKIMKISNSLAEINLKRFKNWNKIHSKENSYSAALCFDGDVYKGLSPRLFSEKEAQVAQESLIIFSGLYGILKPFDLIQPYRLEMGRKINFNNYPYPYNFWKEKISSYLNKTDDVIINLLSNEYANGIDENILKNKMVSVTFKNLVKGNYKIVMTYAKKARGSIASYIIRNNIKTVETLKNFNELNYDFIPELSSEKELVFYSPSLKR